MCFQTEYGGQTYGCGPHYIFVSNWQIWSLVSFRLFFVFNISWSHQQLLKNISDDNKGFSYMGPPLYLCVCTGGGAACLANWNIKDDTARREGAIVGSSFSLPLMFVSFSGLHGINKRKTSYRRRKKQLSRSSQTCCIAKHVKFLSILSVHSSHIVVVIRHTRKSKPLKCQNPCRFLGFFFIFVYLQTY